MLRSTAGSVPSINAEQVLFVLRNANLAIATDQTFTKLFGGTNYAVTNIMAVWKSGTFGIACAGGIYTGAAKTGDAVLAAVQVFSGLTGAQTMQVATLTNILVTKTESATPILSLTTGNTGALTADIFIIGVVVD